MDASNISSVRRPEHSRPAYLHELIISLGYLDLKLKLNSFAARGPPLHVVCTTKAVAISYLLY